MRAIVCATISLLVNASAIAAAPIAPARLGKTSFNLTLPAVATADGRFLAAWQINNFVDNRLDGIAIDEQGHATSEAARTLAGHALVRTVVPQAVVGSGDHFLAAYFDSAYVCRFLRFAADGTPQGDAGLPSFTSVVKIVGSTDNRRVLILRSPYGSPYGILGTLLDQNGIVRADIPLGSAAAAPGGVTALGSGFALLNNDRYGTTVRLLDSDGNVNAPFTIGAASGVDAGQFVGTAATEGGRAIFFWGRQQLYGGPVESGGALVSAASVKALSVPAPANTAVYARKVLWIGSSYVLLMELWTFDATSRPVNTRVAYVRYDRDGNALDPAPVTIAEGGIGNGFADATWNGSVLYVVIGRGDVMGTEYRGIAFDANMTALRSEPLTLLPARQNAVSAASDGARSAAVWREADAEKQSIRAAFLTDGKAGPPVDLASANGYIGEPVVAYGGGVYLAVWEIYHQLFAMRLTAGGVPIDASPFVIATSGINDASFGRLAIAWSGSAFLIAWGGTSVRGVFVSPSGVPGAILDLAAPPNFGTNPALTWDGRRFALAFEYMEFISPFPYAYTPDIGLITLTAEGTQIGGQRKVLSAASMPLVASSGGELLVIAQSSSVVGAWVDVSRSDSPAGPFVLPIASGYASAAWVALRWTGHAYAIAAHTIVGGSAVIETGMLIPLARWMSRVSALTSRPDRTGGPSVAIADEAQEPRVIFSDLQDGGTSQLMIESTDVMPELRRNRAVLH